MPLLADVREPVARRFKLLRHDQAPCGLDSLDGGSKAQHTKELAVFPWRVATARPGAPGDPARSGPVRPLPVLAVPLMRSRGPGLGPAVAAHLAIPAHLLRGKHVHHGKVVAQMRGP